LGFEEVEGMRLVVAFLLGTWDEDAVGDLRLEGEEVGGLEARAEEGLGCSVLLKERVRRRGEVVAGGEVEAYCLRKDAKVVVSQGGPASETLA